MFIKKSVKIFVLVVLVLALSGFTYAFAASNTVPISYAGDGSETISGYEVTNVHYTLATDPTNIANVSFTLDEAATTASVRLVTNGTWFDCDITTLTSVSCDITGVTVLSADLLQVVAAN